MKKINSKFILFALFCILMFGVFIYLVLSLSNFNLIPNSKNTKADINTTEEGSFNALPGVKIETNPISKETNKRSSSVMNLLNVVPFKGTNFTFDYDYSANEFILGINSKNKSLGNSEFDNFLRQNSINSRSWIPNLKTTDF